MSTVIGRDPKRREFQGRQSSHHIRCRLKLKIRLCAGIRKPSRNTVCIDAVFVEVRDGVHWTRIGLQSELEQHPACRYQDYLAPIQVECDRRCIGVPS